MSSDVGIPKGVIPPSQLKKLQAKEVKGVQPKVPSKVMKKLDDATIKSLQIMPSSSLESQIQPFGGVPAIQPISEEEEKVALKAQENPLLLPGKSALVAAEKKAKDPKSISSTRKSKEEPKSFVPASITPDMQVVSRDRELDPFVKEHIDEVSPLLEEYHIKQNEIETANPYLTDTVIYTPQSSKSFYRFIEQNYNDFRLLESLKGSVDPDACAKLEQQTEGKVQAFMYQQFIREYIRNASPYRGILVYHGLGSGKTCSAIAAMEALYGTSDKKIIVMTPFSLRGNFMSEISFCGFQHFNVYNHWVAEPLISESGVTYLYANTVLSLSAKYLKDVLKRAEDSRKVIWIPDFTKKSNYTELTPQEQSDIRAQITNSIESRITFISYNGVTYKDLLNYACTTDENGNRFFDNSIIVIDEIHNLTRLMQGNIMQYITGRPGKKRLIPLETIEPGKWVPKLCKGSEQYMEIHAEMDDKKRDKKRKEPRYSRGFLFYRLLSDARNSKIIGLSGTPIINFPEELGILSNVLSGYIECVEFIVDKTDKESLLQIRNLIEQESRVDIVRFQKADLKTLVLVSVFNEGYERDISNRGPNAVGVKYNKDAQEGIREIYPRIKQRLQTENVIATAEKFVSYPRLPIDEETFKSKFINVNNLSINDENRIVLQKRLAGLISYYKGSKDDFMPRVKKDEVVDCPMSNYALMKYTEARKQEMEGEKGKKQEAGDVFSSVEIFARMKNPSNYRFRSRAMCNFVFPKSIERPFPGSAEEEEISEKVELGGNEKTMIIESSTEQISDEEKKEQEEILLEDQLIPDPVVEEDVQQQGGYHSDDEEYENDFDEEEDYNNNFEEDEEDYNNNFDEDEEEDYENDFDEEDEEEEEFSGGAGEDEEQKAAADMAAKRAKTAKLLAERKKVKPTMVATEQVAIEEPVAAEPSASTLMNAPKKAKKVKPSMIASEPKEEPIAAQPAASTLVNAPKKPKKVKPSMIVASEQVATEPQEESVAAQPAVSTMADVPKKPKKVKPTMVVAEPQMTKEELQSTVSILTDTSKKKVKPAPLEEQEEEKKEKPSVAVVEYIEQIKRAMTTLDNQRANFLNLDDPIEEKKLANYSTKMDNILRRLETSRGSNLVYSQFKTVEGLGVLGIALKANGYVEIKLEGTDENVHFSKETKESLDKGPDAKEKRFIMFTGDGSKDRRTMILNIFNGNFDKLPSSLSSVLIEKYKDKRNMYGDICWVIGITGAGAEGISLKCCRSVHIMEPYWNNVRLDQVKGRAIRICSHKDLPYEERDVEIYTYCTVFSRKQLNSGDVDITLQTTDGGQTSDQKVYGVSVGKDKINQSILQVMKESAVDCGLNSADNERIQCFVYETDSSKDGDIDGPRYLFDPNLDVDILITKMQPKKPQPIAGKSLAVAAAEEQKSDATVERAVIKYKGIEYIISPKPGSADMIYNLYDRRDRFISNPIGEAERDPVLKQLKFTRIRFF